MIVWRLARRHFAPTAVAAFSGAGAAFRGGRWNSPNVTVAYASSSAALALVEYLVHVELAWVPRDLQFYEAAIPDDAITEVESLPNDWNAFPPQPSSAAVGDAFIAAKEYLAMRVPSTVIPFASNYLVNPAHERFAEIVFSEPIAFDLDARLTRRTPSGG